jgi:hypothetical protein
MNAVCKTKRGSSAPGEEALEVPETWITVEAPHLRIVDEALWEAAHRRLDVTRARYARLTAGKLVGPPDPTQESPHLLTGFVRCARCGGGVSAQRVSTRKRTTRSYCVCTTFRVRGPALCPRGFRARLQDLDAAILDRIGRDVLSEDVLMDAAQTAAERHAASQNSHAGPDRPHAIARELGHVQARIGRLVDAYEEGALGLDELKARRGPLDTRRATLEAERDALAGPPLPATALDVGALRRRLDEWHEMLRQTSDIARRLLRLLLPEPITLERTAEGVRFRGRIAYAPLVVGAVGVVQAVVPPGCHARTSRRDFFPR